MRGCMKIAYINGFDCDGVITVGVHPGRNDVIITGRSYEEKKETNAMLKTRGIDNPVFYNQRRFSEKTRKSSGIHKAQVIAQLKDAGVVVQNFFEDDPIQKGEIESRCDWVNVVEVRHNLTEKENVRHVNDF